MFFNERQLIQIQIYLSLSDQDVLLSCHTDGQAACNFGGEKTK